MATSTPVLDITTVQPTVLIDGESYELRSRDDLSILQNAVNAKNFTRFNALRMNRDRTAKEEQDFRSVLATLCGVVLDAPASIRAKLKQSEQLAVINAFFSQLATTGTTVTRRQQTSKKSLRA